ncbi:MAG: zf-HC2 domain-containing protein, partial [Nitrospirota bacterium]|nr:zf-HC2 domain-containing protein [Nitrospirota bacterium]
MECADIQKKLSAYIDDALSPEERMLIDEHLTSCQECKASLADMRKTLEYVQKLEDIEPPPWLAQKVMTKIKEEVVATRFRAKPKRGILQKLFYPL